MRYVLTGVHLEPDDAAMEGIELFETDGLTVSAIAIDDDTSIADPAVIRRAVEARSRLLDRSTFIAVRYGAPVKSVAEVRERIGGRTARWRELLTARQQLVEVTLKIAPETRAERPERTPGTSGKEYLLKLHELRRSNVDDAQRTAIEQRFSFARATKWIARQDGGIELVALVDRNELPSVRSAGEALQSDFPTLAFILSGPWPLEAFADE